MLKNPNIACRVYAPVGSHRDLLAYLVRRLLENGANSSFVHQLTDESVGMDVLLLSPLYVEALPSLPIPADLLGNRKNSTGLDLSVHTMRQPLLVAWQAVNVLEMPFLDTKLAYSLINTGASSYQKWSNVTVAERSVVLRRAADVCIAPFAQRASAARPCGCCACMKALPTR